MLENSEEPRSTVFSLPARWLEKILESKTSSLVLVVILVLLAALPLLGVGVMTTRAAAPHYIERN